MSETRSLRTFSKHSPASPGYVARVTSEELPSYPVREIDLYGVNIIHSRLPELAKLADAAKPFYEWIEGRCSSMRSNSESLTENLMAMTAVEIRDLIEDCLRADGEPGVPALFDGVGRQYGHAKACYYFFAWMLRDAPQQRLQPMLARAQRATSTNKTRVMTEALAILFVSYRGVLRTFKWSAVREVVMDRLEGSRRSIRGRHSEVVVRTAITVALQTFYEKHGSYGRFSGVQVPATEVRIGNETFDVSVDLMQAKQIAERILVPVKSRETEGGGHAHLFTRDINSAIAVARAADEINWVVAFIIAQNWSPREQEHVRDVSDFAVSLTISPNDFETLDPSTQRALNRFIEQVLLGEIEPKSG